MKGVTNAMSNAVYVGLCVTSHDNAENTVSTLANATLTQLTTVPSVSNLTAMAEDGRVVLVWSASSGATNYVVRRAVVSGGPYELLGASGAAATYTDARVTNGTTCFYVVAAQNATGESAPSGEVSATPAWDFVNRATGGTAAASSQNSGPETAAQAFDGIVTSKWYNAGTAPPGWIQYRFAGVAWPIVQYRLSSANDVAQRDPVNWQLLGSHDGSAWTVLDTRTGEVFSARYLTKIYNLSSSAAYEYCRLAISSNSGGSGYGLQLAEMALMSTEDQPRPAAPTELRATALSETQCRLTWTDNATSETVFVTERAPTGSNGWSVVHGDLPADVTNDLDDGLSPLATYDYRVGCENGHGLSAYAMVTNVVMPAGVGDGIPGSWRLQHFGDGLVTNGQSCSTCDPDADGQSNWQEYHADTDPTNALSNLSLVGITIGSSGEISWSARPGKLYQVHVAPSPLGPWTTGMAVAATSELMRTPLVPLPGEGGSIIRLQVTP